MSLVPRPNITSIGIVQPELERLLEAAHEQALHAARGDSGARAQCASMLREAAGVLRMLELHDAIQLVQDMALTVADHDCSPQADEALAAAFKVLARYPAHVCTVREARPELLRPEHDLLRSRCGLAPMPEYLFLPPTGTTDCRCPPRSAMAHTEDPGSLVRRLRHLYQLGLLALVRGRFDPVHVHMMRRACERMLLLAGGGEAGERWWLLDGVLEAIATGALHATPGRLRVLRSGDGWLRDWASDPQCRGKALDVEQRRALLTLIARAAAGQRVREVRALTGMELVLPDDAMLARERRLLLGDPDADAAALVTAVQAEFHRVRRALDALDPGAAAGSDVLQEVGAALGEAARLLGSAGLEAASVPLEEQRERLDDRITTCGEADERMLQRLADVVVEAEAALGDFAREHGVAEAVSMNAGTVDTLTEARAAALRSARENIENVKREVALASEAEPQVLAVASARAELDLVRGALLMLGQRDSATLASRAIELLGTTAGGVAAQTSELLADLLVGLEYCIASLQVGDLPDNRVFDAVRPAVQSPRLAAAC